VSVRVVLDRDPESIDGAAATQLQVLGESGVSLATETEAITGEVVVDALVGYGLSGDLRGTPRTLVETIELVDSTVVSLDVPTGRDATTGGVLGAAVDPDRILTLALPKTGLSAVEAPIELADISVPAGVCERLGIDYENPFGSTDRVGLSNRE
jgi:NAD(P)H-hydrate epimerase